MVFNKRMKIFEQKWMGSVQELHKEALGLLEWYLSQEDHIQSHVTSGDIQTRFIEIKGALNVYRDQLLSMPDYLNAYAKVEEVAAVLDELHDLMNNPRDIHGSSFKKNSTGIIRIEELLLNDSLSSEDLEKITNMPYEAFINQIQTLPVESRYYGYTAIISEYILETKKMKIYNLNYLAELADDTRKLLAFTMDMRGFDEGIFWSPIFHPLSQTRQFIVISFIRGLWGYYRQKQQIQANNYVSASVE